MLKCFQPVAQVQDTEADRLSTFFSRNTYISGKYADEDSFSKLHTHILSLPGGNEANRLFYLALPPTVYHDVTKNIKHHCMSTKSVHALLFLFYCLLIVCMGLFVHFPLFCWNSVSQVIFVLLTFEPSSQSSYLSPVVSHTCHCSVFVQRLEQGDCREAVWT